MTEAASRRAVLAVGATALLLPVALRLSTDVGGAAPEVTLGFAGALILVLLASARPPPRWSPGVAVAFAVIAALWLGALLVSRGPALLPLAVDAILLATLLALALSTRAAHGAERARRAGYALLALAVGAALLGRHDLLSGTATDDAASAAAAVVLAALAFAPWPGARRDALATAAALGAYAAVAASLLLAIGYGTDAVVAPHRAAELLLSGRNPYADFDMLEALSRFGLSDRLATHLVDGQPVGSLNYPAGSFLVPAPFVALGLADLRWLYLAELLLIALLAAARARQPQVVLALVVGNVLLLRQYALAGVDPAWALGVVCAWLFLERRRLSPLALGLGAAARQTAWFFAPFYLLAVLRRDGPREVTSRAAIIAAAFALPNLPFFLAAPGAWLDSVFAPLLAPLEPYGVGLVRLALAGAIPLLAQGAYAVAAGAIFVALLALAWRAWPRFAPGVRTFPLLPLFFAWRSLQSYFVLLPLLAALEDAEERAR